MPTHQAAWLNAKQASLEVAAAETPQPGPGELLVRVEVIAFSPIEYKLQSFEVHPLIYPNILGLSFAGTIESVGSGVQGFAKGDRVVCGRADRTLNDARFGAYQQYALATPGSTSHLPPSITFEAGAATVVNLATVTAACSVYLGLDRPVLSGTAPQNGRKVLVYGGSSSCGGLAVRYLTAAGYTVVTTSSPKNHEAVRALGPAAVIDHTLPAEKIVTELHSHGPYQGILDTIGVPSVTKILMEYLHSVGGGEYNTLVPPQIEAKDVPDDVRAKFESYGWVFEKPEYHEMKQWLHSHLLPDGLVAGVIVPTPAQWVKGGLASAQQALDMMRRGDVSGHKLVLNPWE